MSLYESVYILRQDISSSEVTKINDSFMGLIKNNGGEILKKEYWGLRDLAYEIKKNKKGHYMMLVLDAPNRTLQELHQKMKLSENVLRNMSLKIEEFNGKDSIILSSMKEKV